jgi:hypothetical protein
MKRKMYEQVVCADGFSMSVQASPGSYCRPKNNVGPYESVEVGFPSSYDYYLQPHAEDPDNPTGTVYGWVPADTVIMCIDAHGGMVSGELPPLVKTEFESIT